MLIAWIPYLIFYGYWLYKKRPHKREKNYRFSLSNFTISLKQW